MDSIILQRLKFWGPVDHVKNLKQEPCQWLTNLFKTYTPHVNDLMKYANSKKLSNFED